MLYQVVVFIHLGFVLGLCCTLCVEWTTLSGMRRTNEADPFRAWSRQLQVMERFHPLWAVGILATGAYLTTTAWTWSTAFIDASLFAVVASAVIGGAFNGPRFKRLDTASAALETGVVPAALRKDVNAPGLCAWSSDRRDALALLHHDRQA